MPSSARSAKCTSSGLQYAVVHGNNGELDLAKKKKKESPSATDSDLDLDLESCCNAGRAGLAVVYTDAMARGQGRGYGLWARQRTGVGTVVPSLLGLLFCSDLVEEAPPHPRLIERYTK
ncbi:hypothetical protein H4582DRAFT_2059201 [Lactarius indigo]|nr:hypothetical protein H4582DRAFT_2059201 [Lactarius indigo]